MGGAGGGVIRYSAHSSVHMYLREKNPPTALGLDELKGIHVVDTRLIRRRQEEAGGRGGK